MLSSKRGVINNNTKKPIDLFNARVNKTKTCWLWKNKPCTVTGYGNITINYKQIGAHRFAYELFKGKIPKGLLVCHSCDVKMCVNPDHLWLGTIGDNNRDAYSKGINKTIGERVKRFPAETIVCNKCSKELPHTKEFFNKHKYGRLGYTCKKCHSKYHKEARKIKNALKKTS